MGFSLAHVDAEIGILARPIRHLPTVQLGKQRAQGLVVVAQNHHSIERHPIHELEERPLDVLHVAIAVHVLAINVRHHGQNRRQLKKGPVALVRLGNQVVGITQPRVRTHRIHAPTHDNRGIEPAPGEYRRDHGRGRRFAVHPGDRDAVLQAHQFRQHFRAADHGNELLVRSRDFGIVRRDGGTGHHDFGAHDVVRSVAFENYGAELGQPLRNRRALQIRARNLVS